MRAQAGVQLGERAGGPLAALAGGDQLAAGVAPGFPQLASLVGLHDRSAKARGSSATSAWRPGSMPMPSAPTVVVTAGRPPAIASPTLP